MRNKIREKIIAGILLAAYIVQALCKYYVSCQGHIMGAKMERDMRKELFDHYQALSFSYYDQNNTGRMMSRMVSDLFDISEMAHHGPENLFISVVKIIGSFFFLFRIQNKLASILLVVVVFMALFSFKQNKRIRLYRMIQKIVFWPSFYRWINIDRFFPAILKGC